MAVRRTSNGMLAMAVFLVIAGVAALANAPGGRHAAAIVTVAFVAAAFWANYALFGDIRPLHVGTNIVVAALVLALLWFGSSGQTR
jgi:hypothetical protein